MPSDERDPRRDPRPGDVTKNGSDVMLVVRRSDDIVWWAWSGQRWNDLCSTPIELWEKYSKNEEVLHVSE